MKLVVKCEGGSEVKILRMYKIVWNNYCDLFWSLGVKVEKKENWGYLELRDIKMKIGKG